MFFASGYAAAIAIAPAYAKTVELFRELLARGKRVQHTDQIHEYLKGKNDLKGKDITDIVHVYSALERSLDIRPGTTWQTSYLDNLAKL